MQRRRWVIHTRRVTGEEAWLVITVPPNGGGAILFSISSPAPRSRSPMSVRGSMREQGHSRDAIALGPDEVEKVRSALAEARIVALVDMGHW